MRRAVIAAALLLVVSCAAPRPAEVARAQPVAPKVPPAGLALTIASDRVRDDRVDVALRWTFAPGAPLPTELRFAPVHEASLEGLVAHDDAGTLAVVRTGPRLAFARAVQGPLAVRYTVVLARTPAGDGSYAEPVEVHVLGADVLALPDEEPRTPVALALRTGVLAAGGASSFGLGADESFAASYAELRRGWFLAGDVGTATFHASDGDDIAAWVGHTAFDGRWVSAETAAVRGRVDTWVGRSVSPESPPASLLFVPAHRDDVPVVVGLAARGLVVSVDRRAAWTAPARILVAQALVQRYVGGFLAVGDRAEAGRFWSEGFSRTIAREIVFGLGTIDHADRAAELNALLATIAFAPAPRAVVAARGAVGATALDVALRKKERSLQQLVRTLLEASAHDGKDVLPSDAFLHRVAEDAGEPGLRALAAAEPELPPDLLGRCYRLVRKDLVPFELGFTTSAGEELAITEVIRGSRAAAAGLAVGDIVKDLRYVADRPDAPVTLTVTRTGKPRAVRFFPAGTPKPGRVFERLPNIPDDHC